MRSLLASLVVLGLLAAVPLWVENPYALHVMILIFLAVIQGESWNVLGGYAGQYSVGHAAFFGVGAYVTVMLLQFKQLAPWYGVWVAVAVAVALGVAIGAITFRLRGPYFVLASIATAEIVRLITLNWRDMTNGAEGILLSEIPALRVGGVVVTDFTTKAPFYWTGLFLAALTVAVTWWVQHSKLGYYLQAIREDQDAAHSLGIPLARYKNYALAISAFFTAFAGALYGLYVGFVDTAVQTVEVSVQIVLICIIGGIGTILGPVVGALVLIPLAEALRANMVAEAIFKLGVDDSSRAGIFLKENLAHAHLLIYGILVVVVILYMPEGVVGFARRLWRRRRSARDRAAGGEAA
jgi:branched-chain amino acid transport system permease protein